MKKPDRGPLTEPHALNNIDSIKKKKKKHGLYSVEEGIIKMLIFTD